MDKMNVHESTVTTNWKCSFTTERYGRRALRVADPQHSNQLPATTHDTSDNSSDCFKRAL